VRPPQCIRCKQWPEVDPPEERPEPLSDQPVPVTESAAPGAEFAEENIFHIPLDDEAPGAPPLPPARPIRRDVMVDAGCPCMSCRLFRPMATFVDGVQGVRLCWSSDPRWDFTCRRG
jgi:hypothetical protein